MYITVPEIAEELGVTRQCVHQNYIGKCIPAERVGRQVLVLRKDFEKFKKMERPNGVQISRR